MTAVKEQALSMIQSLSDESVVYIIKILEGFKGLEAKNENTISEKELQKRLSDMRIGINCAEHDLIED